MISSSSSFFISDLQRKQQLDVAICSLNFNFPDNHHRRGKCFACGSRVFRVVINFAHLNQLGLGFL